MIPEDVQHNLDMHERYGHNGVEAEVDHLKRLFDLHSQRLDAHQEHLTHIAEVLERLVGEVLQLQKTCKDLRDAPH